MVLRDFLDLVEVLAILFLDTGPSHCQPGSVGYQQRRFGRPNATGTDLQKLQFR